jgi:hypothetical protein
MRRRDLHLIFRSISLPAALFFGLAACTVVSQGINDHQRSWWRGLQDCHNMTGTNGTNVPLLDIHKGAGKHRECSPLSTPP